MDAQSPSIGLFLRWYSPRCWVVYTSFPKLFELRNLATATARVMGQGRVAAARRVHFMKCLMEARTMTCPRMCLVQRLSIIFGPSYTAVNVSERAKLGKTIGIYQEDDYKGVSLIEEVENIKEHWFRCVGSHSDGKEWNKWLACRLWNSWTRAKICCRKCKLWFSSSRCWHRWVGWLWKQKLLRKTTMWMKQA